MKNRIVLLVVAAFFAALGDGSGAVTKTRLGALNPKSGMVVTDVDLSGVGGAGNYEVVSNKAMNAAPATKIELDCFVKDDGTIFHFVTNGVWSTVNKYGSGWNDSYLAGARIYMWYNYETGSANWTWYLTGGSSSGYRTVQADADADILRFRYSAEQTNVFVRGRMLLYAGEVGDMISKRFDASTNYTDRVVGAFAKTGTVSRASTYGTPTRWTDAAGCVWEVSDGWCWNGVTLVPDGVNSWLSNDDDSWLVFDNGTWSAGIEVLADTLSCTGQEDATTLTLQGEYATITLNRTFTTNLVGRVALTNDIPNVSGYATQQQATSAAIAVADAKISTNNTAFVSAVLAAPLVGADASDIAELSEYGSYGTVGAAILALIAGLAALKRRMGTAETALAQKASLTDLPYALAEIGVAYELSAATSPITYYDDGAYVAVDAVVEPIESGGDVTGYMLKIAGGSNIASYTADGSFARWESSGWTVGEGAYVDPQIVLTGHLLDRANNLVDATTRDVTLTLPAYQEGKVRDLLVHVLLGDDGTNPYTVTFAFPTSESGTGFVVEGDDASTAALPAPTAAGTWWYSFTECEPHKFAVSLKQLQSVSQPTQTQGGS